MQDNTISKAFPNAINKPLDDIDAMTLSNDFNAITNDLDKDLQEQFLKVLESSNSYEDAMNKLLNQGIKQDKLESVMAQVLTNISLKGFVDA